MSENKLAGTGTGKIATLLDIPGDYFERHSCEIFINADREQRFEFDQALRQHKTFLKRCQPGNEKAQKRIEVMQRYGYILAQPIPVPDELVDIPEEGEPIEFAPRQNVTFRRMKVSGLPKLISYAGEISIRERQQLKFLGESDLTTTILDWFIAYWRRAWPYFVEDADGQVRGMAVLHQDHGHRSTLTIALSAAYDEFPLLETFLEKMITIARARFSVLNLWIPESWHRCRKAMKMPGVSSIANGLMPDYAEDEKGCMETELLYFLNPHKALTREDIQRQQKNNPPE